jgi:hypothetical protein
MPRRFESDPEVGPTTLGSSLRAGVRLVCWCNKCLYQTDADVAALVARYGPNSPRRNGAGGCAARAATPMTAILW